MDPIAARRDHFHRCDYGGQSDHHRARDFAPPIAPPDATIRYIAHPRKRRSFRLLAANEPARSDEPRLEIVAPGRPVSRRRSSTGVWCRDCSHEVEPDPAEMARHYGAETTVPEWHKRLVCGNCGSKQVDFVATGARR